MVLSKKDAPRSLRNVPLLFVGDTAQKTGLAATPDEWKLTALKPLRHGEPTASVSRQLQTPRPVVSARYVKVQLTTANHLNLYEVEVFDSLGTNVALRKDASMSTTEGNYVASLVVDGDLTSKAISNFGMSWWEVDLGKEVMDIASIRIHHAFCGGDVSGDACSLRLSYADLILRDENDEESFKVDVGDADGVYVLDFVVNSFIPTWDIDFFGVGTNFTLSSDDEIVLNYEIGRNRTYNTFVYQKDCKTDITDIAGNATDSRTPKPNSGTTDSLILSYSIDKSAIGNSSLWNSTSKQLEFCQVTQLVIPANGDQKEMVITEDIREITINFDLDVDFNITSDLGAATIEQGNDTANVDSYIDAYKCNGDDFDRDDKDLLPGTLLFVCIKSVSTDVEIASLDEMFITQGSKKITVIEDDDVKFTSLTERTYVSGAGVLVSTRVPINTFTYADKESIEIAGGLTLQLAGPDGIPRKLQAGIGAKVDANEVANFDITVNLQPETVTKEEEATMNSANDVASKGFAVLGMMFASAYAMW